MSIVNNIRKQLAIIEKNKSQKSTIKISGRSHNE